jgi:RNase H-fold protein (predicted Holliday junction resolvase)
MKYLLGFDPGRDKCGVAVVEKVVEKVTDTPAIDLLGQGVEDRGNSKSCVDRVCLHQILPSTAAISGLQDLCRQFDFEILVMGDGTTAKEWQEKFRQSLAIPVVLVNERNSTLEARDRYWQMFPPQGFQKIIPQSLRRINRPIDDIVAILLVERFLATQ